MTKKADAPYEREMTPQEIAADEAHKAAHAKALAEESARNEIIKQRIVAGDIDPAIKPDQLEVTPQDHPPRAADTTRTSAEQYGGARGPAPAETAAEPTTRKR